jgi:hypothetical protein
MILMVFVLRILEPKFRLRDTNFSDYRVECTLLIINDTSHHFRAEQKSYREIRLACQIDKSKNLL